MSQTCGMLSFHRKEQPDQVYRLWMAIFAHAGYNNVLVQYINPNDINNNLWLARKGWKREVTHINDTKEKIIDGL